MQESTSSAPAEGVAAYIGIDWADQKHDVNLPRFDGHGNIFGPFLFGAAEKMSDALERVDQLPRVLILRLHLVTAMDATALNALESIIERFQHHGSTVVLSGLHRQPLDMLRKAGFIDVIGRENLCAHFDAALSRAKAILPAPDLSKGRADQIRPASIRISFLTDWPTTPLVLPTSHAASAT
ncbi:MAG TPA: sodium-independent anion transporter [Chthoniobacterales bacterium]|jgi:anti-anti-sigma regulatory factor|nr:sodium-independent anion transporter [Chthoniobacterales bacterium]